MSENITPLPLSRDKYGNVLDANGNQLSIRGVASFCSGTTARMLEAERMTDLVVEAVNAYPALTARVKELEEALRGCLNYIANTESELGITLDSAERARAALKGVK